MTETEFKQLAQQGYNRIPLVAEAFADLETPLSLYLKLAHVQAHGERSFLLESVVGGERFGRYSFIGLPARTLLRALGLAKKPNSGLSQSSDGPPSFAANAKDLGVLIAVGIGIPLYSNAAGVLPLVEALHANMDGGKAVIFMTQSVPINDPSAPPGK